MLPHTHTNTHTVLSPILSHVEVHFNSCSEFESWLGEQEESLNECGSIGADLKRLVVQNELLKVRTVVFVCIHSQH